MSDGHRSDRVSKDGDFTLPKEDAERIIAVLEGVLGTITPLVRDDSRLRQPPELGNTATAQWASKTMQDTATGQDGMIAQMESMSEELPKLIATLRLAARRGEYPRTPVTETE